MASGDIPFEPTPEFIAILRSELKERNFPPCNQGLALSVPPENEPDVEMVGVLQVSSSKRKGGKVSKK